MNLNMNSLFSKTAATPQSQAVKGRQEGETYNHWGIRVCGMVQGSLTALEPYLQNVYNYVLNGQRKDGDLQDRRKREIEAEIAQKGNDIKNIDAQLSANEQSQDKKEKELEELKEEKTKLEGTAYRPNKEAKTKFILGLVVLIPLCFYLFLFYSSTFYSAFFKNFNESTNVLNSMFDADALSQAYQSGVTELGFVLCAPVIFMGLGFALHFFSIQKTRIKYAKMAAIISITFVFDAILAYMIGKRLHEMAVIIGTASMDSAYGLHEAVSDINTWAVIFCGFIVYIIWGIVFDMTISAYNDFDLNRVQIRHIERKIKECKKKMEELAEQKTQLLNKKNQLEQEQTGLRSQLTNKNFIDLNVVRKEMTDFYSGWIAQMKLLNMSQDELDKAQGIFDKQKDLLTK